MTSQQIGSLLFACLAGFCYLFYLPCFFSPFRKWWMVHSARTFVLGQCKYVQLIQTAHGKKSSKQNQRFKSIYVLSLPISLCMCLFIWRRDDALNILLLDKKKLFARLSWSKMHFSTAKWTLSNLHSIAALHAKRKQTNTLKQNTTQHNTAKLFSSSLWTF